MNDRKERKRRICSEKRREKSRDAARSRRGKENELFAELALQLPLPQGMAQYLDKASIVRLTLSYLHLRTVLSNIGTEDVKTSKTDDLLSSMLDNFLLLLSQSGHVVYSSEAITKHIGINQMELIGQNIFEFIHPCDQEEIRDILSFKQDSLKSGQQDYDFFIRMKCTLTNQGRTVNIRSASWKMLHCIGRVRHPCPVPASCRTPNGCLVLLCESIPFPDSMETKENQNMFLSRHNVDMCFTDCDHRVKDLVGYDASELVGRSVYEYYHALDTDHIRKTHQSLVTKGQASTRHYRLLAKKGGYVWAQTDAAVIYNNRSGQPQCVICINYVLSGLEESEVVFSLEQTKNLLKPYTSNMPISQSVDFFAQTPEELAQLAPEPGDTIVPLNFNNEDTELPDLNQSYSDPLGYTPEIFRTKKGGAFKKEFQMYFSEKQINSNVEEPRKLPRGNYNASSFSNHDVSEEQLYSQPVKFIESMFEWDYEGQNRVGLQNDLSELDLETLAPYIPMDGEDFQLTPISYDTKEGVSSLPESEDCAYEATFPAPEQTDENYTISPSSSLKDVHSCFPTKLEAPSHFQQTANTPQRSLNPLFNSVVYQFWSEQKPPAHCMQPSGHRLGAVTPLGAGRGCSGPGCDNEIPQKRRKQNDCFNPIQCNTEYVCSSLWERQQTLWKRKKTYLKPRKITGFLTWADRDPYLWNAGTAGSHSYVHDVNRNATLQMSLAPNIGHHLNRTSLSPENLPERTGLSNCLLHPALDRSVLPVLTRWECEVNAPLTGPSRLLHGAEILRVLDQAAL
ncbi:endothelial PAS domain-containing protein 1-like isoform X1 [Polypterus senegalus]|uniref:endothelial PAS domain-containing protein 1-like isoform X1 n=1 Tax=Polypterus senegalus TaxID=55291 RepID=UPI0019642BFC|nr:endothelial PAS domain-containing protein 1-like isoform X1 [Polypterus senegalus]